MTQTERRLCFVEHVRDSMLQADTVTRFQAHALGQAWGWLSVNDLRSMENVNPVNSGDEYRVSLNMTPANGDGESPDARAQVTARSNDNRTSPEAEVSASGERR